MDTDLDLSVTGIYALLAQQLQAAQDLIALNQAITSQLRESETTDENVDPGIGFQPSLDGSDGPAIHASDFGRILFCAALEPVALDSAKRSVSSGPFGLSPRGSSENQKYHQAKDTPEFLKRATSPLSDLTEPLLTAESDTSDQTKKNTLYEDEKAEQPGKIRRMATMEAPQSSGRVLTRRKPHAFATPPAGKKAVPSDKPGREYNVEDRYKTTGFCQEAARSNYFQNATVAVILLNTLWMSIDTDYNHADVLSEALLVFQVMDNFFCAYFTIEISLRFGAFEKKIDAAKDYWFVFDTSLVLLMIWETWIQVLMFRLNGDVSEGGMRSASVLRIFRAFRLLRISRMTRLLRSMPELFILVKSIGTAMRCMCATLCMLIIVIYVFSILFTQLTEGTQIKHDHFGSVPEAMNFMLLQVLCGFDADFILKLLSVSVVYYVLWLMYVLIGSLSIMNVLIGILCEVVSGTADSEKERAIRTDIALQINSIGVADDMNISKAVMMMTLEDRNIEKHLEEIGIDVHALLDFVHYFEDTTEMLLPHFVELCVQFRGPKLTTVNDVVNLRKYISMEVGLIENTINAKMRRMSASSMEEKK
jgi:hypothetical protein